MRTQPGRALSDEVLLAEIRDVAARLGKTSLTGIDIAANSEISQDLLRRRCGGVSKALRQAGIEQGKLGRRHTEDEVFENLLEVWTHYGRPPTVSEINKPPSTVGSHTYMRRYGRWRDALKSFVERANSEGDGDRAFGPEQDLPSSADRTGPTETPTTSTADQSRPESASQGNALPRVTRAAPTNAKPADRREPNKRLKYKVFVRDKSRCRLCGRSAVTDPSCRLHIDHIIPFSKGGKTTLENLQALCSDCNVGKSNLTV